MDSKQGEVLLWKVSPVDNWQVWKFLFPLVAKKAGERAVFVVSCLAGAVSRHTIPKPKKVIRSETLSFVFIDALKWEVELSERETFCSDIVAKVLDAIASCEDYDEVLSDWQRKMLVKLAESLHLDRLSLCYKNPRHLLAFSEYLSASCTLIKLDLTIVSSGLSKLGDVLQSLHKLVHFELFISGGSSVGIFQSFPQSCSLLTRSKVSGNSRHSSNTR